MKAIKLSTLVILAASTFSAFATGPCQDAENTLEVNKCLGGELARAEADQAKYLAAAQERLNSEEESRPKLSVEQKSWESYRDLHCGNVFDLWAGGTGRVAKNLSCSIALTRDRTHAIWRDFLTYADSTPPRLPEPNNYEAQPGVQADVHEKP